MIDIKKGITFIIRPIDENDNKIDSGLPSDVPVPTNEKVKEFVDKVRRLSNDYGLIIDKADQSDIIKNGICKSDRKASEEKGFNNGVELTCLAYNKANNVGVPIIKPVFVFDELNK